MFDLFCPFTFDGSDFSVVKNIDDWPFIPRVGDSIYALQHAMAVEDVGYFLDGSNPVAVSVTTSMQVLTCEPIQDFIAYCMEHGWHFEVSSDSKPEFLDLFPLSHLPYDHRNAAVIK